MTKFLFLTLTLLALALAACSAGNSEPAAPIGEGAPARTVSAGGGAYTEISVQQLYRMLQEKDFLFVNVHIPFEGDIPNTDISIPFNEIEQNLDQLPDEKDAKIVLYCRSDRMSSMAAETLVGLGYTNIWNVDGGMVEWENAGLPIKR